MSIYTDNGYSNRKDYLESLSDEYDIPYYIVSAYAQELGPTEDFDGLINELEDYLEQKKTEKLVLGD